MDNEGLMIFIFQAIIALFAFFVVAPCVLNAFTPQYPCKPGRCPIK